MDNKGRINLPARLRKYVSSDANDTFVITRGLDKCLFVYPLDEWNSMEQSMRQRLSPSNPQDRYYIRTLLQYATESQLDAQSRIAVPKELLQFAGIQDQVLILGVLDRIELWNPGDHDEYQKKQPESFEDVAQKVFEK